MRVRLVIPKKTAQAAAARPKDPLTAEVRALLTQGEVPPHYVEVRPDPKTPGRLVAVLPKEELAEEIV